MSFEPEKFFIGIIDFFSILLPGALVTYLVKDTFGPLIFGTGAPAPGSAESWVMFLFSSYLLGHLIFLIGSELDRAYNSIRGATHWQEETRLKKGKLPASRLGKYLATRWFQEDPDLALRQVIAIRDKTLKQIDGKPPINAFQWARARLTLEQPAALAQVQRFEADSKFFRSFVVVLAILLLWNIALGAWRVVLLCIPLLYLAFRRYADQRYKSTEHAYWYIITMEGSRLRKVPGKK